jgi:hypothetical protein
MDVLRRIVSLVLLVGVLAGCGLLEEEPEVEAVTPMTLAGTVGEVAPAERRIVLSVPVEEVDVLVLDEDATVMGLDGSAETLAALRPGTAIEAVGWLEEPGVLLVREVRLTEAAPAQAQAVSPPVEVGQVALEVPMAGAVVESPLEVRGWVAQTPPDATLRVRVYDVQSRVLAEQFLPVTGEVGQLGTFAAQVPFAGAPAGGTGRVEVVALGAGGETTPAGAVARVTFGGVPGDTPEVTLQGRVGDVTLSGRVITLEAPAAGFGRVVLAEGAALFGLDGGTIPLEALAPGTRIEAIGRPGEGDALVAEWVRVIDELAPPESPEPEVTITAQVLNLVPDSGVIMLADTVEGFNSVALLERTVLYGPDGGVISMMDIPEGATIEVLGRPGALNVLNAWEIWVR